MSLTGWVNQLSLLEESRADSEVKSEIRQELDFHLSMLIEENKAAGMTDTEARIDAMRQFGDFDSIELSCQHIDLMPRQIGKRMRLGLLAGIAALLALAMVAIYRGQSDHQATLNHLETTIAGLNEQLSMIADRSPPVVVETFPAYGASAVDPSVSEIRVTFSKTMRDQSWSWCNTEQPFPECVAPIHFLDNQKTCVMPVALRPDTEYVISINSPNHKNFRDHEGRSAEPYVLAFSTAAANPNHSIHPKD
ncbi:MAG: Ig-like domain-containing protein [Pirellulales bacterium]|nr:Ig-like domain-containing protein [Pirellulales bacterium]